MIRTNLNKQQNNNQEYLHITVYVITHMYDYIMYTFVQYNSNVLQITRFLSAWIITNL